MQGLVPASRESLSCEKRRDASAALPPSLSLENRKVYLRRLSESSVNICVYISRPSRTLGIPPGSRSKWRKAERRSWRGGLLQSLSHFEGAIRCHPNWLYALRLVGKEEQMTSFILRNGFGSRRRQQPVPWRERSKFSERLLGRA